MATVGKTLALAGLLACGAVHADGSSKAGTTVAAKSEKIAAKSSGSAKASKAALAAPGPGRMQVEEPNASAPALSARESKAWQKNHAHGLTDEQKQAFRDRKENMDSMIAVIKEKRKAMASAKPGERAAIARELHSLMLEKDSGPSNPDVAATARVDGNPGAQAGKLPDLDPSKQKADGEAYRRAKEAHRPPPRK